jgi:NAD dependent epimerase/dehydratase family enzyme
MGDQLLLNGSAVYPKKLLDNGYEFKFKTIESALKNIIDR